MNLKRKILAIFAILMLLALAGAWMIFRSAALDRLAAQNIGDLSNFASIIARQLEDGNFDILERSATGIEGLRLTLINAQGKVIFDSLENADKMDNHSGRAEVKTALADGAGTSMRYSDTLKAWLNYYARKISSPHGELVLRVSSPLRGIEQNFAQLGSNFFAWAVPLIFMLFFFGLWLTKRLFSPLEAIVATAANMRFDQQPFSVKFPLQGDTEIQRLANSLNEMGTRLGTALGDIDRRRDELSRIVEALPVGVVLTDTSHKIRYVNSIARELLGETTGISKGGIVNRLLPNREMSDMLDDADSSKEFYFPQREKKHVKVTSVSVSGTGGKMLVIRDLTSEKNLEEIRRNFIIDAGHEFQTPLTIIRMAAELLHENEKLDDVEKNNLEKIINSQERLTELVDELLLLTKADSLKGDSDLEEINISEMLREIATNLENHPSTVKTKFEFDFDGEISIKGNREELERAFSNIIGNALKYSQDRENPCVKIGLKDKKIWVSDNGTGISDEIMGQIFEPFRRGDAARSKGGYGLGLSIAKRVIEAVGGKISAANNPDAGCTFTISTDTARQNIP